MTAIASMAARVLTIMISIVSVPLTLNYLGVERYGLWLTISATIGMFAFADLGIGNGLLNAVSEAYGKSDVGLARQYIASAFAILTLVAVGIAALFVIIYPYVPWAALFNVQSELAATEVGPSVFVFVICFLIGIPLAIVGQIQMGYQEGYLSQLWTVLGKVLTLVALLVVIYLQGGLPLLILALVGAPLIAALLNALHLFRIRHPELWPSLQEAKIGYAKRLLRIGSFFFILQILGIIAFTSDSFVLTRLLGPEAVAQFGVTNQLFGIISILLSFGLAPLWPAYAEAVAVGDRAWIKKAFQRSMALTLAISIPVALLLLVFGHDLLRLWIGTEVVPPMSLLVAAAIWQCLNGISGNFAVLLNGSSVIRFQIICSALMAIANIIISILLVQRIGVSGVLFGSIIAQTIFVLLPTSIFVRRMLWPSGREKVRLQYEHD